MEKFYFLILDNIAILTDRTSCGDLTELEHAVVHGAVFSDIDYKFLKTRDQVRSIFVRCIQNNIFLHRVSCLEYSFMLSGVTVLRKLT